jgi:bifunctional non-homologous end joining protein LigD
MSDKLSTYRRKRDFRRTSEPEGASKAGTDQGRYVMHMHAASHDHFDLRLEQDGVLRSWALPKGPSLAPGEKRLAVEVEDHPLEYGEFEGVIPRDEYGGGTVMLWDRGHWKPRGKLRDDRIDFDLDGEKLRGHWTLVRTRGKKSSGKGSGKSWLLLKRSDETQAKPDDLSVATGRTMAQIADEEVSPTKREAEPPDPAILDKARKQAAPATPDVQLATLVQAPPAGEEWIHELKFDGYRLTATIHRGRVSLFTRNGHDWTRRFPEIVSALEQLPVTEAIVDGEIVAPQPDGSTSFRKLQEWLSTKSAGAGKGKLVYQAFDLLYLEGYDLRKTPLLERKGALAQLLGSAGHPDGPVRYSDHVSGQGDQFFEQVCEMGLEGMVSKRVSSAYSSGRQRTWLKTKCTHQDEFVVGGFTRPSGARQGFGSLLLGAYNGNSLVYVGRVGSGFTGHQLASLHQQLRALARKTSPFTGEMPETAGVQWVTPQIVVDVEFTERTGSGALRHPVFRGLREDKSASEIQMVTANQTGGPAKPGKTETGARKQSAARSTRKQSDSPLVAGVPITHPDRILYPDQGITKLDVARYYEQVQDHLLPHLAGRPLSLLRCPEGLEEDCFFQKHPDKSFAPEVPRTSIAEKKGGSSTYLYVSSASDLVWLVQFGVLEFHPWGCTITDVEKPDTLIFDLDPGPDVSWRAITRAATSLKDRLDSLGLASFLQASGGKGLHLVVPVKPKWGWDELKAFTQGISEAHAADDPKALTTNMSKAKRRGKVFIDYLRNGRGNTSIARYSTRARERATVATPLRWDELSSGATANRYTITNLRRRLGALKADPWENYEDARNTISKRLLEQYTGG